GAEEAATLVGLVLLTWALSFGSWFATQPWGAASWLMIISILVWTAFRFGQRGTATLVFLIACLATAATLQGHGAFVMSNRKTSLLLLQNFIALVTIMSLILAADVSQRRRIAAGLSASEQRYRELFEHNPQPMWVFDYESLRFLAVNPAAVRRYGYSREQFLTMTIADLRLPEDAPKLRESVSGSGQGLEVAMQQRHRTKQGNFLEVEIAWRSLNFDGRPAAL